MEIKPPKIINDPIHGFIELHPLAVKIIDTPQFQRLRFIKQLGATYFVYPGTSHNRFEHSIGTYQVAGMLMKELQKRSLQSLPASARSDESEEGDTYAQVHRICADDKAQVSDDQSSDGQLVLTESIRGTSNSSGAGNLENGEECEPEEDIPQIKDIDILCVQIAALCHDLGHGPFSHLFDGMFMPKVGENWQHEEGSLLMFDVLYDNLKQSFEKWKIYEKEKQLIKDCIHPRSVKLKVKGREFLYEVVSNKRSGVDVDKFDYFVRDCYHLGMHSNFDHNRFLKTARLVRYQYPDEKTPVWTIAFRRKDEDEVYQLFHTRRTLHERAYQHPVCKAVEVMITDALIKANEYLTFQGINGEHLTLSKTITDMKAYVKLTDEVIFRILNSDPQSTEHEDLKAARIILQRIMERELYPKIGSWKFDRHLKVSVEEFQKETKQNLSEDLKEQFDDLTEFYRYTLDYGKNEGHPAKNVIFYTKTDPTRGVPCDAKDLSTIYPGAKICFHVYFRSEGKILTTLENTQITAIQEALHKAEEEIRKRKEKKKLAP